MLINLLPGIQTGNFKSLAQGISGIENQKEGSFELLKNLPFSVTPVIGFTGPPGAGKSTILNLVIGDLVRENKKVAVLCVDPSSPYHQGAFLGDRIRMNQWTGNPSVFIRSLSARGSLGGLNPGIFEITDLLKAAPFDYILIETVGIGQSEIEIVSVADFTIMILMPGSGDEIQALKAGVLEVADLFVVNKSDYPYTMDFVRNLKSALHLGSKDTRIIESIATDGKGISEISAAILAGIYTPGQHQVEILVEKAYRLILAEKMKAVDKKELGKILSEKANLEDFNLYKFVATYLSADR